MVINSTLASEPIIVGITSMVNTLRLVVGGVFGLYILLFIFRIYAYKRNRMLFKKLRKEIVKMTHSLEELQAEVRGLRREKASKAKPKKKAKRR